MILVNSDYNTGIVNFDIPKNGQLDILSIRNLMGYTGVEVNNDLGFQGNWENQLLN